MSGRALPITGLATLLGLLGLSGCAAPEGASSGPTAPVRTGVIVVQNDTGQGVFGLRFAEVGQGEDWGPDLLAGGDVLARGQSRDWELPVGRYRIQATLGDGTVLAGPAGYWVDPDGETTCVLKPSGAESTGTLTLVNETGFAIARVNFSLTSSAGWGDDRLKRVLAPGARQSWVVKPGSYNLRVEFQDGVSLEAPGAYQVVPGEERVYRLAAE